MKPDLRLGVAVPGLEISRQDAFAFLAPGVPVAVIYFPATRAGFVRDDSTMRNLVAVSTWGGIWYLWFDPAGASAERHLRCAGDLAPKRK